MFGIWTIPAYGAQKQDVVKHVDLIQSYDEASGRFIQVLEDQYQFSSTIPQDLVTSGGVRFEQFAEEILYILEKDGTVIDYESNQVITDSGQYHLRLLVMPQINRAGMEEPSSEQLQNDSFVLENLQILNQDDTISADFYFTIIKNAVSNLNYIKAPIGYRIQHILWNDTAMPFSSEKWCRIKQDGTYKIQFMPQNTAMPEYETTFLKDTQPPLLQFEGVDSNGTAKKSCKYKSTEEPIQISVYRDGRLTLEDSGEIRTPGLYRIMVQDQAGNATSYLIHVKKEYPFLLLFLLLGGLVSLAAGTYLVFRHQKLIVR